MYHDQKAVEKFEDFIKDKDIKVCIETGTWKGEGTMWFLKYFDIVYTIEVDHIYFAEAGYNFKKEGYEFKKSEKYKEMVFNTYEKKISLMGNWDSIPKKIIKKIIHIYGDSAEAMDVLFNKLKFDNFLVYLDAHWDWQQPPIDQYWPILRELQVLAENKQKPYIIIHDFKHHKNYGYDIFNNKPLDLDYIKEDLDNVGEYKISYNEETAIKEPRGILYAEP